MSSQMIEIETTDGVADAYLAKPDDGSPHPGVLFLMDAFGLRSQIEHMSDRVAARGYVVLAPNLFYRAGKDPAGEMPDMSAAGARDAFMQRLLPLMAALTAEAVESDADAYLRRLEADSGGPIALTGYCMGAPVGLHIVEMHPTRVVALGGFHGGRLVTDAPDSPHRSVGSIQAELYLAFADNDQSMTPENIAELERALDEAGVEYRAEVYEGAAHGY